jgi:hypothetical protein
MSMDQEKTKQRRPKNAGLFEREPGAEDVSAEYK